MIEPSTWEQFLQFVNRAGFAWANLLGQDRMYPWTPVDGSGAGLTFTGVEGFYYRVGKLCHAFATLTYPATVDASNAIIGGIPFLTLNLDGARSGQLIYSNSNLATKFLTTKNTRQGSFYDITGTQLTNAQMTTSGNVIAIHYLVA